MLIPAKPYPSTPAHIVVVSNEKGGSGKSTIAIHIAVALLKAGQRVVTLDLDSRQKTLTHYVQNRVAWRDRNRTELEIPTHLVVERSEGVRIDENEIAESNSLIGKVATLEHKHDFIVIDTPGADTYLMRLANAIADTLITPLNDSFVDFDVLGAVDPVTYALTDTSHYSELVRAARQARRKVDQADIDWIVVRNRFSSLNSANKRYLTEGLHQLSLQLGFRCADGLSERTIFRDLFPRGLTALDLNSSTLAKSTARSYRSAQREVESLLAALKLPTNEKSCRRAAARREWFANRDRPLEVHFVLQ